MTVKSGQTWSGLVVCKDATGALATPTVGPAGALYVDGVSNAASVTISGSNPYKWTVTLPTLTAGQCVSMYITATIATIATASVVAEDVADTTIVSDVAALLPAVGAGLAGGLPVLDANLTASANVTLWKGDTPDDLDDGKVQTTGGAGSGSSAYSNTITDDSANPLDGVEVWITSDSGGASTVASTTTDTLGAFTVYLDPGIYYLWLAKGGYNFPNPTTITVS